MQTLAALYFAIGLACAGWVVVSASERGARVAASALAAFVLWPLWAPFALTVQAAPARGPLASRVALALGGSCARSKSLSAPGPLSRSETALLLRQVEVAERRLGQFDARLAALDHEATGSSPPSPAARARSELRASSYAQLQALRAREQAALVELAELCELLQTQELLAGFGRSERVAELRDELWLRVQALSELEGSLASTGAAR